MSPSSTAVVAAQIIEIANDLRGVDTPYTEETNVKNRKGLVSGTGPYLWFNYCWEA